MTAFKRITHVIYDMDGLLLDTERFYTEVNSIIAARYGTRFDWSLKSRMLGKKATDSARIIVDALQLPLTPEQYLAEREPLLEGRFPMAEPMPGALRLTRHLHARGIPQGVASSSDRRLFEMKTSRHREWFSIFECVMLPDDPSVCHGKPAPDLFLAAARVLRAAPANCLVFEDAPAGIDAARAAGMSIVAIADPRLDGGDFSDADEVLHSLEDFRLEHWGLPPFDQD
jgi:HAD superfamily hydrolase (TIGR01509 family)